jgi:hypothetical protein
MIGRLFLFALLLIQSITIEANSLVIGKVTGSDGSPLSFASVYINGTTRGTTTNIEGHYSIEVEASDKQLVFRYIGYKTRVVDILINGSSPIALDVILEAESYSLAEVQVKSDAEDPAYAIIRKAIANRKKNGNNVDAFTCSAYVKGLQRLTKYPKKFLGQEIQLDEFIDTVSGIVYLSESVSTLEYKKPNVKETMVSSKVSGNSRGFSFNQASEMSLNIYENILNIANLSPRGFISPISPSAMVYYQYRFDGSFLEDGIWVNRIEVIPKRKSDPIFSGYIYIQDGTWRVHSFDLMITKDSQIQFVDSLRVNQIYIPTSSDGKSWMPGSVSYSFSFGIFGFVGNGRFVASYSAYDLTPSFGKRHFSGEVLKIEKGSNEKDSAYWNNIRPVPLTAEEARDYVVRDSTQKVKESKEYLDSLDKVSNKFNLASIFTGFSYSMRYRKTRISFPGLIDNFQYSTIEGANLSLSANLSYNPEDNKDIDASASIRYGMAIEKVYGSISYREVFNPRLFGTWNFSAGDDLAQFNGAAPISPFMNTSYTLFDGNNYLKAYRKQFLKAGVRIEPLNGIRIGFGAEYAFRSAVKNNSFVSWAKSGEEKFTVNNPPFAGIVDDPFPSSSALVLQGSLRLRFKQKYADRPNLRYVVESKFPWINLQYNIAVPRGGMFDADFSLLKVGVEDRLKLGMAGTFSYQLMAGKFLNVNHAQFMDLFHFNGNRTIFSEFRSERFDLLRYYEYSTIDRYYAAYIEHELGGVILNKLPLIRKLKLVEVLGARFLGVPEKPGYAEFSFGLEKLGLLRADFVFSLDEDGKSQTGFVIGLKRDLGR